MTLTYTLSHETAQALCRAAEETATTSEDLAERIVALVLQSCARENRERRQAWDALLDLRADLFVWGPEEEQDA